MDVCRDFQTVNIRTQLGEVVVAQAAFLSFIEFEPLIEIIKRIARNSNLNHGRPIECFTESQS